MHNKMAIKSDFGVNLGDDVAELLEVYDAISVLVGILDHLIDLS